MRGETTVVVGGGCSGVLATASLVRHGIGPVTVIDPDQRVGPGVVYRTDEPAHVLNSRAGTMSVHPHDPDGFVTWCRGEGIAAGPDDFLPRGTYGRYLAATFTELAGTGAVRHVRARVAQLLPSARRRRRGGLRRRLGHRRTARDPGAGTAGAHLPAPARRVGYGTVSTTSPTRGFPALSTTSHQPHPSCCWAPG